MLRGGCYDLTTTPPYGPWRELAASTGLAGDLPPLPRLLAGDETTAMSSHDALLAEVREFLAALAIPHPLLLVLEDLHWVDAASLDLLRFIARQLGSLPLLLIVTYRADELTRRHPLYQLLPTLVREAAADRLDLRRLDEADIVTLVTTRYVLPAPDQARLVAYLQERAEGNPFYTGELLRSLAEESVLRPAGDGWTLRELEGIRLPPLLRQVIDGRIVRLGEEARESLAVAAVVGQEVALDLWATVTDAGEDLVLPIVEKAVEARLLEPSRDGGSVQFTHALVREALYESILPPRRRLWHRRVGEALAVLPTPDPDRVSHHFQQARDARAVEWLVRGGERAQRAYAWMTAAERFSAAATLMETEPSRARERGWLLYRIGRMLRFANPIQGGASLEEAQRMAHAVADPVLAAYALFDRGILRYHAGDVRRGLAEMEAGDAALAALPDEARLDDAVATWVADALPAREPAPSRGVAIASTGRDLHPRRGTLVVYLAGTGRHAEALMLGEAYLAVAAAVPEPDPVIVASVADALYGLGMVYTAHGQPDEARQALARSREAYRAADHFGVAGISARFELVETTLRYDPTRREERERVAAEAVEGTTRGGGAWLGGHPPQISHLSLLLLEGGWSEAWRLLLAERGIAHTSIHRQETMRFLGLLARDRGEPELAWEPIRDVLPEGAATDPGGCGFRFATVLQRVAADLALDAGDAPLAHEWLAAHDRWLAWSGSVAGQAEGQLGWARYHRLVGDLDLAREQAEAALTLASEPRQPLALLAAHRSLGELDTAAGHVADAEHHLDEALALADACGAPFERALTLLALAELRARMGQTSEARTLLDEVRAICTPLEAAPTLARADALAARLSQAPPAAPPMHPAGLSSREVEVLRLLAAGRSNPEIAAALFISPRTATTHVSNIIGKLGVVSRAEAAAWAVRQGLA